MTVNTDKNGGKTKHSLAQFVRRRGLNRVIRSASHPLHQLVSKVVAGLDGSKLNALLNGDILLNPAKLGVVIFFGPDGAEQERQEEFRRATRLSDLPLITISRHRAELVEVDTNLSLGTVSAIWLHIVEKNDRATARRSPVNHFLTTKQQDQDTGIGHDEPYQLDFEFLALELYLPSSSGTPKLVTPEGHARRMHQLSHDHPQIFALAVSGQFMEAFEHARLLPETGRNAIGRTSAIISVLVHFQVYAAEHGQRAHAWVLRAREACIPLVLRGEIELNGEIRMGGPIALAQMLFNLAKKWFRNMDECEPATAPAARPSGPRGNAEIMVEGIVLDHYLRARNETLDTIGEAIFPKKSVMLTSIETVRALVKTANPRVDIMTHWFCGVTEREALLMISKRLCQSRENIQFLIDNPDVIIGADLVELLYPLTLNPFSNVSDFAVRRQCLQLIWLADKRIDHSEAAWSDDAQDADDADVAGGNKGSMASADRALAKIGTRRLAGLPPATKLDEFFEAFDPLRRPSRRAP